MGVSHYNLKVYCSGLSVEYPVFDKSLKRGTGAYDRKNSLVSLGYQLNKQAKRKIKNVLIYRFYKSHKNKFDRLKFFTFTIPESSYYSHNTVKEADTYYIKKLSMCLENITKNYDCRGYVWVAEKTKKGVIHFHCILEAGYIEAKALSNYWAKLCQFEGFENSVHFGFESKNGHKKTKIKSAKALVSYLTEYVTKNSSTIYGRGYGMNKFFSDTYKKAYKTFEGGAFMGTTGRQYDCLLYAEELEPITILDNGLDKPLKVYIRIIDFDLCVLYFFPELWSPDIEVKKIYDKENKRQLAIITS